MGAIEDTRKVLQDFVAPEFRAITVRLDALEKRFDRKFEKVDQGFEKIDQRLAVSENRFNAIDLKLNDMEHRAERRHEQMMTELEKTARYNDILECFARLKSKDLPPQ